MPAERVAMRHVREILRLKFAGVAIREIARRAGVAPSTVRATLARLQAAGRTWPLPEDMTDVRLEAELYKDSGARQGLRRHAEPDWAAVQREQKRKHVTLSVLWDTHFANYPDGYRYSRSNARARTQDRCCIQVNAVSLTDLAALVHSLRGQFHRPLDSSIVRFDPRSSASYQAKPRPTRPPLSPFQNGLACLSIAKPPIAMIGGSNQAVDDPVIQCQKIIASEMSRPGRLQIGTQGGFISELVGNLIGNDTPIQAKKKSMRECTQKPRYVDSMIERRPMSQTRVYLMTGRIAFHLTRG